MNKKNVLIIITLFMTGVIAGLFFAWTVSVMNGLAKLPDREFILSMQSMNREIQNPVFFLFFFGPVILLPICTIISFPKSSPGHVGFILAATIIYILGVLGVTIIKNVPLNNMLDAFDVAASAAEQRHAIRCDFEQPWNNWNLVRTFSNLVAFLLLLIGSFKK